MKPDQALSDWVVELHKRLTHQQLWALLAENYEVEQALGKALHYPEAYPHVGEVDDGSVVVGPHTPGTLAKEAAERILSLEKELAGVKARLHTGP